MRLWSTTNPDGLSPFLVAPTEGYVNWSRDCAWMNSPIRSVLGFRKRYIGYQHSLVPTAHILSKHDEFFVLVVSLDTMSRTRSRATILVLLGTGHNFTICDRLN